MIKESLRNIGLTDGEIRVYLSLLETGSTTTGSLIKKSKISGSKIYEVLDRLIEKGLASYTIKNNIKYFEAAPPNKILNYLQERQTKIEQEKKEIENILPQLITKQQESKPGEVKVFMGFEGIKTVNEDIINSLKKGEEWLDMGLTEQPKTWESYFNRRQIYRAKKGIILKQLLNEKYNSLYEKRKNLPHTQIRFLPQSMEMPTSTEIYGNKIAILLLNPNYPMVVVIDNKEIAESFRKYFYTLWEYAASPTKIIYGKEGAVQVLKEIVEAGKKGIPNYGFGTDKNYYHIYLRKELDWFNKQEKKYNMKTKLLFMEHIRKQDNPYAEIRYLKKEFVSPLRIMIADNKVFMVDFTKPWTTIIIEKKEIAESYKKHFNLLWKIAKP